MEEHVSRDEHQLVPGAGSTSGGAFVVETEAPPLLRVQGASKSFGGAKALDDVSFTLGLGRALGVVGENGAGKVDAHEGAGRCLSRRHVRGDRRAAR